MCIALNVLFGKLLEYAEATLKERDQSEGHNGSAGDRVG